MELFIADSGIPGAGRGLFAGQDFKRGQLILHITGPRLSAFEINNNEEPNDYLLEINDDSGDCIDVQGEARYANDAKGISSTPGLVNNAQFCSCDDHSMYMEATRTIRKGQEIFVSYGKGYWKELFKEQKLLRAANQKLAAEVLV
jgi:hypothetical protein